MTCGLAGGDFAEDAAAAAFAEGGADLGGARAMTELAAAGGFENDMVDVGLADRPPPDGVDDF